MLVYLALASLMGLLFLRVPTAFLPDEDQGYLFMLVQTPVGATAGRTEQALDQIAGLFPQSGEAAVASSSRWPGSASAARARMRASASCC